MLQQPGRYELKEEIGQGGFAIVYRGVDTQLGRDVALKELRPILLNDAGWVKRFRREARAIARLDHPHIVPIYDIYEPDERLYLVMRLVNGPALDGLISSRQHIPWAETLNVISDVAAGLDYAHSQGILHRDLKPANILIDIDRGPMLSDFGLAKLAGENSMSISASGSIVGTPHYIAPEVWEGKGSVAQSDIYALGCIVCEMLTGEKIFKGETAPVVMMAHFQPLSLPAAWPDGVPAGLSDVLAKALSNDPDERYVSAGEFAKALAALSLQPDQPVAKAANDPAKRPPPAVAASPLHVDMPDSDADVNTEPVPPTHSAPAKDGRPDKPWQPWQMDWGDWSQSWWSEEDQEERPLVHDSSNKWREFLAHLGPYVMVIGGLGVLNYVTGSDYPWFLWPAIGWGIGLAFHLWAALSENMVRFSDKWNSLVQHLVSYIIVIGGLSLMNLLSGDYPWVLWPALIWGVGLGIHFWTTIIDKDDAGKKSKRGRRSRRGESRRQRRRNQKAADAAVSAAPEPHLASGSLQAHLVKAKTYQRQINDLVNTTTNRQIQPHLQEVATQVDDWVQAIEDLSERVDDFQQNPVIRHDLESVPRSIQKLEAKLATETDSTTRAELERTLKNRKNQLAALQSLQNSMKRAELKIENTLSLLGTIYPQILTSQSTNHAADYSRISVAVDEEVRTLEDHLEALEEVKFGRVG